MTKEYTGEYHIIKNETGHVLNRFGFGDGDPIIIDSHVIGKDLSKKSELICVPVKIVELEHD